MELVRQLRRWLAPAAQALSLLLVLELRAPASQGESNLALWRELDSGSAARAAAAIERLASAGPSAGVAALSLPPAEWSALALAPRRARAELFARCADAEGIELAIATLADPDAAIRVRLSGFLAAPHLRDAAADRRVRALEELALRDQADEVRSAAASALARMDGAAARAAWERLLEASDAEVVSAALGAMAGDVQSSGLAAGWLRRAALGEIPRFDGAQLAAWLTRHLPALLQRSAGGGESAADRSLFAALDRHPDPQLARAGLAAAVTLAERCAAAGDAARAQRVLANALAAGLPRREVLRDAARIALQSGELDAARAAAAALVRESPANADSGGRSARAVALLLQAACELAGEDARAAEVWLAQADELIAAKAREGATFRLVEAGEGETLDLALRVLVSLHRLTAELVGGRTPADTRALERARDADLRLLELRLALARRASLASGERGASFDELLYHELGPASLYFGARASSGAVREKRIELELALLQTLANVSRGSLPGFVAEQVFDERLADPLADDERRTALEALRQLRTQALNDALARRIDELEREVQQRQADPSELVQMLTWQRVLRDRQREELAQPADSLLRLREFSRAGLSMVERLRENGRAARARALAEQVVEDIQALRGVLDDGQFELTLSRAESTLGGVLMDQDEPVAAEEALTRALERLRALDQRLESNGSEQGRATLRGARASVLVSLAVNANVKRRDPARAVEYFERAYELDQSDFMRVLLACYRARAGRSEEARAILRSTAIAPGDYYNAACTWALLGESALALDYLQRDFDELRTSPGARARQQEWARSDPDLEALRGDPRFERLLAPRAEEQER